MNIRILIVEDNELDSAAIQQTIETEQLAYDCVFAATVADALIQFEKPFDIVLTDYHLPDGDGFVILTSVKDTPVIFMVATGDEAIAGRAIRSGAAEYIIKDSQHGYITLIPTLITRILRQSDVAKPLRTIEVERNLIAALQVSATGKIVDCNETLARLLGYDSIKSLLNILWDQLVVQDFAVIYAELNTKKALSGKELTLHHKNGDEYYFVANLVLIPESGKTEAAIRILLIDITAQRRAEIDLHLMKQAVEASNIAITLVDARQPDMPLIYVNEAFQIITGYSKREILGKNCRFLQRDDHIQDGLTILREGLRRGKSTSVTIRNYRKDGTRFWNDLMVSPLYDQKGTITHFIGIQKDVTVQKQIEEALRASEEKLRSLLNSQTSYVIRIDMNGRYTYWNANFERNFGWIHQQRPLLGASALDTICEYHHQRTYDAVAQSISVPGETVQVELDKPAPDGNTRTTLWEFVCLTDAQGTASEIQCIGFDVTARKRAEKALAEANNLLERRVVDRTAELERVKDRIEAIFNHSGDSLLLISVKDGIQQANYAFEALFGDTVDRYFGMSLSALVQPEEAAIIDRIVQEVAATHQTRQIETRSNRANGIITDIELNIAPVNRSDQAVTSLVCIIHDISERKQIERIRRESEAMLQSVIENIPVQIFWKDQHSVYRGCNSLFARTVGLATPIDIIGLTDHDIVPEHAAKWEMEDRDTMALGKPILNVEDFILQPDGSTRWLRSNKVALRDPNGNANGILVTIEDITASKQAELAIAEERNLLRTVIDTVPDYIYVKDNQHRMVLNNVSHARSLGGGTPRDITGKTDFDVFPAAMATKFHADEEQLFLTQSPILNTEERSISQDGSEIWALTTKVPLRNLNGEVIGLVGITHDVTSIKSSEETLRRSEQKLRESQKMLRLVLDTIPVRVFWKDRNSVLQGGNQLFARDAGFNTVEALLGKSEKDLPIVAIEEDAYRSDDSAIMKIGVTQVEHEEILILPDHSKLVVQTSKLPLRNEQGEIIGILVVYVDISERKSAEQQLRYLASLQENMYDAVVSTDLDFRIQSWNRASERLYGWSANEVIGKNLIDVTNTVFIGESTIGAVNRLMQLGTWTGEVIQHHRDGTEVYILGSMVLHENEHGIPVGIIEVHRDISDRKKTETALEQAYQVQGQMQSYLKALHEITLILTRTETLDEFYRYVVEQGLTRFNFERMGLLLFDTKTGTAHGTYGTDAQGKVVDERHVTLDPGQIHGVLPRILNRDEQFVFDPDAQLFDHDRYLRAGQNAVAALWDGAILGWISIDNGIHGIPIPKAQLDIFALYALTVGSLLARKIAELNLKMLAQRLELATRSSGIGIWDWYIKSDHLIWDDRMFALYGITPEEFPDTTAIRKRVVHPGDVARLEAEIAAVIRREKDYDIEFRVIWPDGSERYIKANALVLFAPDGTAERMIGVNMDITELKQAEQVLRTALEKQTELSNLKTKFVSMASHEFRTPLAVILGTTETLSAYRAKLSEVQIDERLNKIKWQISHMTNIMDDVLQLARLQAGKSLQFTPQSLDINALCLDIIEEFQSLPGNHDRLIYHNPMVTCVGQCDSQLMRQIIGNLISNALKYSALDKVVTIALTKGKSDFTLVVRDQGIGIPLQDQSYLFEPFNRASNVGTISGTGLGLSIAKQAVELHRGTITVDSQLNIGTTFIITMPIALN